MSECVYVQVWTHMDTNTGMSMPAPRQESGVREWHTPERQRNPPVNVWIRMRTDAGLSTPAAASAEKGASKLNTFLDAVYTYRGGPAKSAAGDDAEVVEAEEESGRGGGDPGSPRQRRRGQQQHHSLEPALVVA